MKRYGYKEPVTDEQLINLIEMGVQNSTGDFLNSSDLARERLKALMSTLEFHQIICLLKVFLLLLILLPQKL